MKKTTVKVKNTEPIIPKTVLKNFGFLFDENTKLWKLSVGNPLIWYDIILPEKPKWYDFRIAICKTIDKSLSDGFEEGKTETNEQKLAANFLKNCTNSYYKAINDKTQKNVGKVLTNHLIDTLNKMDMN